MLSGDGVLMQTIESSVSTACHSVLGEAAFRALITQERRRSERSGRTMVLLLARVEGDVTEERMAMRDVGAKVLTDLKTDIDRMGWFEARRTIGLLVPEIEPGDAPTVCAQLRVKWEDAILQAFGRTLQPRLSTQLRMYPEPEAVSENVAELMDPFFYPELSMDGGRGGASHTLKRGMDIVLSVLLLTLAFPLFALLAGLVKCSSRGPVFFRQVRVGHLMKPFVMYKLRTMYVDVDHQVHHDYVSWFITASHTTKSTSENNGNTVFKLANDTRITPIGRVLRRTSLDELPQLWNVLLGDMSLVGPRPPLPYEVGQYKPWHRARMVEAKPGITGLWQVVGRSRTTFDEMVRLDLQYARSMSLWFDVKILLATPGAMISGKGAH